MGDDKGAFEAFEQALAIDASDDALRGQYIELAGRLKRYVDAAKTLTRVLSVAKEPSIKARTGAQLGLMLLYSGDPKRAKTTLAAVLTVADAPADAVLVAARALWEILEKERDPRALCEVLERVATLEPDPEKRRQADERLSELAMQLRDKPRAIASYERLLSTSSRANALAALAPLYEASGSPDKLARLLEERAKDTEDPDTARGLLMRAVQVRSSEASDVPGAIATCAAVVERFGPARDVLAILLPMLEQEKRWPELAAALAQDAELTTTGAERARLLARVGTLRLTGLRDVGGAITAFDESLAFDPAQPSARTALEKLAMSGDHRLQAVRVLEPVYRREGATDALLRMLDARGTLSPDVDERLGALREAADLLAAGTGRAKSPAQAIDVVGRGLAEAVAGERPLGEWLDRVDQIIPPGTDANRRAAIFARAIGERAVTSVEVSALAQRAAESQLLAGGFDPAIALLRRALAFEPRSTALLLRIGQIERSDRRDLEAAIATYEAVLALDGADAGAQAALEELYAEARRWADLSALLEGRLVHLSGAEARAARTRLARVAAEHGDEPRARMQCARLLEDPDLAQEDLDAVDYAAERLGDTDLAHAVLKRRAEMATDPRERVGWLEKLGQLDEEKRGDLEAAAAAWKRAAILADENGDNDTARRLFWRARKVAPEDHEVTVRLVAVCERAECWSDLPRLYAAMSDETADEVERVNLALRTAHVLAERLGDPAGAARALDAMLARLAETGGGGAAQRAELLLARASAVAVDPASMDDAARTYREILADDRLTATHPAAVAAFQKLVDRDADSPERRADRRWLLEWSAEHAPVEERTARLLAWARDEETTFADPARALALHRRVLVIDPDADESLTAVARLALGTGEIEEAIAALRSRRDRAAGSARIAIELQIARLLFARTPGSQEAIAILERACEETADVEERATILKRLVDATTAGDNGAARRGWFERLSDLERDRGNLDAALAIAVRAAREMPDVPELWDRAEELTRAVSRPEDVAALYEGVFAGDIGKEAALALGERAVMFFEEWFEQPGRVVKILERVLALDPTADWAFDRLKLVLDSAERWDELFALYDRALESASGAKRTTLLEDAAQTAKDFADRPDRAIQYIEQLHELRPTDTKLASALERLYERQDRHRELVALLSARLPSLKRDDAARTRLRVAALWLDDLGEPGAALEAVEPLLQGAGAKTVASEVWPLLERVLAALPFTPEPRSSTVPPPPVEEIAIPRSKRGRKSEAPAALRGSLRKRTAGWLRDQYAATGRDADLARMLLVFLEGVRSHKERVRAHLEVAALYEKVGALLDALEQTGFVLILTPDDDAQRAKLADLADRTGQFERLASLLAEAAESAEGQARRSALMVQAADVRAERLGDAPGAIALLSSVLAARKVPDADVLVASRKLEALLGATGRAEERLDVAERIASVESDEGERRMAIGRAARLATELGQDARGIALWERRLSQDPRDIEALDGLVDLLDRAGKSARLAEVLELRAASATDVDRRRSDRVRVARLLGEVLDRPTEAIAAWRGIEKDFGEADDAATALAGLLRATERWKELALLFARQAERSMDGEARAELLRQLGDVESGQLDEKEAAIRTYASALEADPRSRGARTGLQAIANDETHRAAAVGVLLGALRTCDDWQAILELASHRLLAASSDKDRLGVLLESAEIAEKRAGDTGLAFEAVRRAFSIAPGDERVESEMARLADASGAAQALVLAYRDAIEGAAKGDPALVARLWKKIGAALETRPGDARGALTAYLEVVAKAADVDAACAAVRVAAGLAEWDVAARAMVDLAALQGSASEDVLSAFEREAEQSAAWDASTAALARAIPAAGLAGNPARDIQARLAAWHRDRRADADAAEAALGLALEHDRTSATLLSDLAALQRRHPARPLVDTLLQLSKAKGGDLALLREAAEVARDAVADPSLALAILGDVLELARDRWIGDAKDADGALAATAFAEWAIESLARLHEEGGDAKAVANVLVDGSELPFELPVRRMMRRRAARIAVDRLADHDRAIALYLSLFDDDPHDAEAIDRLAAMYTELGRKGDLLRLRERQIAAAESTGERLALRLQAAKLYADLGDSAEAAGALRANLGEDARHEESVEALAAMLDAPASARELGDLLSAQAQITESAGDVGRAASLWFRAAEVAEHRLSDPAAAEAHHARVVALEPRPASFDALARLAQARGDSAATARRLESLLDVVEPEKRSDAILRLAEALVLAGEPDRAAERLESSLAVQPDAEPLRVRLADLYREQQQWTKLARLVSDSAALAADEPTRLSRLLEAAKLFTDRCAEPEQAVPLLEQATALAPADQAIRLALAEAMSQAKRFDEARAILKQMIAAFGGRRPKERAPVHYQMARLELATGHRATALAELDTATRIDPQNPEILRTLAELARDDGQLERAEKSYRALLVVLRRRADAREYASIARSEVLLELSAIAQRDGETDRASEILESAIEAAAQDEFEQERLETQLRKRGDDETLVRLLEAKLSHLGDSPAAVKTLGELGQVFADRLGRPERALDMLLRAIALEPQRAATHASALSLARSLGKVGRYVDGAAALVDAAADAGDVQLACGLLVRLGGVVEADLGDGRRAAELYQRAVSLGSRSPELLRSLDRLYDAAGDAEKHADLLALRVEMETLEGGPRAASDAVYRLAALRLASEATLESGVEMIEKALDIDPQLERAGDLLRRALATSPGHAKLLDLYERVGRKEGQERTLVDALRLRSELPGSAVGTVREGVDVAMRLGDGPLAEALLERFVEARRQGPEVADLPWALGALADLREAAGDLRKAVELKREAAEIADPDVARALKFEVARIATGKLGDLALAAEAYEALYRADPADREAWEPLLDVYRKSGDRRKVVVLLEAVVDYVEDAGERARLRLERVRTMMENAELDDAAAAPLLRDIVDEDGSQVEAALILAAILDRTGDRQGLIELLGRQIDAAKDRSDASAVASLALRLGGLLETTDRVEARNVYYAGLDWAAKNRVLLDALLRMLQDNEDAAERSDVLERRLAAEVGSAAEEMALFLYAARNELGDAAAAERALELGFRACPASLPLRQQLEDAYRERSDWAKLAELYVIDAGARVDTKERLERLKEAAALWRNELHDLRTAASVLRLALDVAPDDASLLREHVDVLVEAEDRASAIAEVSAALDRLTDDTARAPLLAMRAAVRAAGHDMHGALEDLEGAFELDREKNAADLLTALGVAREAASSARDPEKVREVRLREAEVLPYTGNVDAARAILGELVRHNPKDRDALSTLASLEAAVDRWDAASAALARLVGLEEGDAAVDASMRLADACDKAGRPGDARTALERARTFAPDNRALRNRLERTYEQSGAWHELANMALEDAGTSADPSARFALFLRAGTVLLEQAGSPRPRSGRSSRRERFCRRIWTPSGSCRTRTRSGGVQGMPWR